MTADERARVGRAAYGASRNRHMRKWENLWDFERAEYCRIGDAAVHEYIQIVAAEWRAGAGHAPAAAPAPLPPVLLARLGDREPEGGAS